MATVSSCEDVSGSVRGSRYRRDRLLDRDIRSSLPLGALDLMLRWFIPEWRGKDPAQTHYEVAADVKSGICTFTYIGSSAEGFYLPPTFRRSQMEQPFSFVFDKRMPRMGDCDIMAVLDLCPVGHEADPSTHLVKETSQTAPGYLRLRHIPTVYLTPETVPAKFNAMCQRRLQNGESFLSEGGKFETYMTFEGMKAHLAATLMETIKGNDMFVHETPNIHERENVTYECTYNGPAITITKHLQTNVVTSYDVGMALACPYWPEEANEWRHRPRLSGWPSRDLIEKITRAGCHFVKTAHWKSSSPDLEWRLSFVCGERELARSFTVRQKQCYQLFKALLGFILSPHTALSSYCLKNVFFWTVEKLPGAVWEDRVEGLATVLLSLLDELIVCLAERDLPQYFLPDNNLLSSRHPDFLRDIRRRIIRFRRDPTTALTHIDSVYRFEHSLPHPFPIELRSIAAELQGGAKFTDLMSTTFLVNIRMLVEYANCHFVADFCHLLDEILTVFNELDWVTFCQGFIAARNIPDCIKGSYYQGFAWCGYVHDMTRVASRVSTARLQRYCDLYSVALCLHSDKHLTVLSTVCLANVLHVTGRSREAIPRLHAILQATHLHQREPDGGLAILQLGKVERSALDSGLQMELLYSRQLTFPLYTLAYYVLIRCCFETGSRDDSADLVEKFEVICSEVATSDDSFMVSTARDVYGLLGQSFLLLGQVDRAIGAFELQHEAEFDSNRKPNHLNKIKFIQRQTVEQPKDI